MKKLVLFVAFIACFSRLSAQLDVKVSPVGLLFTTAAVSVEGSFSRSFSVDMDIFLREDFNQFNVSGKYYFNPERRTEGFHIGAFAGVSSEEGPGLGFLFGSKLISRKNVLFEVGAGIGRTLDDFVIIYAKLHVGYRFERKQKKETLPPVR